MPALDVLAALDPAACELVAGQLTASFLPGRGMLGASLCHDSDELLGRVEDVAAEARACSTCGIPLLYPWANRLNGLRYSAAGRSVALDRASPLLHFDDNGLPIHGVPWPKLTWELATRAIDRVSGRLDWCTDDLLAVFPFPHRLEMTATLRADGLTVETTLFAGGSSALPVSFGFHPYFRLPGVPRADWQLTLPAMRRLLLDARCVPTGEDEPFPAQDIRLRDRVYDDGFVVLTNRPSFSLSGGGRRIFVELLHGYGYAQVYAPRGKDYVALEPMTAPTNALITGRGLNVIEPGGTYSAAFRIRVDV